MIITSTLELRLHDRKQAEIFREILEGDLKRIPMKRSKVIIENFDPNNFTLSFSIEAEDIIAFKATMSNLIQTFQTIENTIIYLEKSKKGIEKASS